MHYLFEGVKHHNLKARLTWSQTNRIIWDNNVRKRQHIEESTWELIQNERFNGMGVVYDAPIKVSGVWGHSLTLNKNSDNSWDFGECTKHEDVKDQSTFEAKRLINYRFHLYISYFCSFIVIQLTWQTLKRLKSINDQSKCYNSCCTCWPSALLFQGFEQTRLLGR